MNDALSPERMNDRNTLARAGIALVYTRLGAWRVQDEAGASLVIVGERLGYDTEAEALAVGLAYLAGRS
jgi:hypothetical protein